LGGAGSVGAGALCVAEGAGLGGGRGGGVGSTAEGSTLGWGSGSGTGAPGEGVDSELGLPTITAMSTPSANTAETPTAITPWRDGGGVGE
jgi:hypothetical protein